MTHKRILIMAGGTGGHIMPALAVADYLKAQGHEVLWLGTPYGLEQGLLKETAHPLALIEFKGIRRNGLRRKLTLPWRLIKACWQTSKIFRQFKPDAVLGMGGYVTVPGGIVAKLHFVPLVIHEQNAIAGMSNRLLSLLAKRTLSAFPHAFAASRQAQVVGNPLRSQLVNVPTPAERYQPLPDKRLRILVIGGSQGAQILNEWVPQVLAKLEGFELQIQHQTGQKHLAATQKYYALYELPAVVLPFIDDMAQALSQADVVIARAGAMTVFEIMAVGVASILVPYPYAVDDHQTANATFLADQQATILLPQAKFTLESMLERINSLASDPQARLQMAENAQALSLPQATQSVAQIILEIANAQKKRTHAAH